MPGVYLLLIGIHMRYFDIHYTDNNVTVKQIRDAVKKEVDGPGKLLGYRAMQKTLRQEHELKVPRDIVYVVMQDVDPEELQAKGHHKLVGYQNSTFPLAIYGRIDTASGKILWLKIWVTNSVPQRIGYWYLEYLYETRILPWYLMTYLRIDKGTETGMMATMHACGGKNYMTTS